MRKKRRNCVFNRPSESRPTTRPVFQTLVGVDSLLVELYGGMKECNL